MTPAETWCLQINTQHCVAASVNLMRTTEQQLPGLVFVQEPWVTKGKPKGPRASLC